MNYFSRKLHDDHADGRTSMAFRLSAAILAGAAVLLFFIVGTDMGAGAAVAWTAAAGIAGAAFMLADVLIVVIMIVVPPVLVIAVLVRFLMS